MKHTLITLAFLLSATQLMAATKDSIVATINGTKIMKSEFIKEFRQQKMVITNKTKTKKNILEYLINRTIGIQKAKSAKLNLDPIVLNKIEDILFHAQVSKDLEPLLKKIKVSEKDIKKYYKNILNTAQHISFSE